MSKLYRASKYLILINFLIFFSNCNSQKSGPGKNNNDTLVSTDTVVKDIPEFFQSNKWRNYFSKEQALLNIKSIEKGYKDLQIRIWIEHGYLPKYSSQLIVFKKTGKTIIGELHTYTSQHDSNRDSAVLINDKRDALIPESGWKMFIDSIQKLGIYDLPNYEKFPGYNLSADSFGVMIEIATNSKYRIFYYPEYESFKDEIKEAGKMFKIMSLIEYEFKIKVMY
jgi:hypothetical protein